MKNLPDKIFLATTKEVQDLDTSFVGIAHSDPQDIVEPIEYIRKDVFIEKAKEFLWAHTPGTDYHVNYIVKRFEKYMEE